MVKLAEDGETTRCNTAESKIEHHNRRKTEGTYYLLANLVVGPVHPRSTMVELAESSASQIPAEGENCTVERPSTTVAGIKVDAKDTIEGSTETTKERPAGGPGGAGGTLLTKFRHLSVSPRPRDSTPPAHRTSPPAVAATTPDSAASQNQLHHNHHTTISPQGLASIPTAQDRTFSDQGSPNTSQVSTGSVPPTLTSALLAPGRHYDLTPVTRNTSEAALHKYADEAVGAGSSDDDYNMISPDDPSSFLHGEHLALPADLSAPDSTMTGPCIPKLRTAQRTQSVGTIDSGVLQQVYCMPPAAAATALGELTEDMGIPEPVQFPARKFYSFTSRQQYELAMMGQQQHHMLQDDDYSAGVDQGYHVDLEPYQPSRQEDFGGVGILPEEELRGIFIARRQGNSGSSSGESHANHRLLNPIPMGERQWSIPSIHMAHRLQGSTTSYTDNTEEDDESLLFARGGDDDASLSSRGSSLYLPDEAGGGEISEVAQMYPPRLYMPQHIHPQVLMNPQVLMDYAATQSQQPDEDNDADGSGDAVNGISNERRKRKQRRKEERAVEWLHSVEAGNDVLAEAASSKFLTGNNNRRPAAGFKVDNSGSSNDQHTSFNALEPTAALRTTTLAAATTKQPTPAMLRRQASSPPTMEPDATENLALS